MGPRRTHPLGCASTAGGALLGVPACDSKPVWPNLPDSGMASPAALPSPDRKPTDAEIDFHGLSHPGRVRTENQDSFLLATIHRRLVLRHNNVAGRVALPEQEERLAFLAMVADGVGGGVGGADASATALEAAMDYVDHLVAVYSGARAQVGDLAEALQQGALAAHEAVRQRRAVAGITGTMATTLTLFLGVWPTYYLLQVGDSRYYRYRAGVLSQVTRDQTMAQDLVDQGVLSESVAARTPYAHVLSSALGADTTVPVVTRMDADWGNIHLLCSDGLTKHVSDRRIGEVLGSGISAREACEQLLQEALDGGGTDNITIIVGRTVPAAGT